MDTRLTADEVARIAALARLDLDPSETERFARELTAILAYAAELQQVDTSEVETPAPCSSGIWRDDEPAASLDRRDALAAAPDAARDTGLFRVPKVL